MGTAVSGLAFILAERVGVLLPFSLMFSLPTGIVLLAFFGFSSPSTRRAHQQSDPPDISPYVFLDPMSPLPASLRSAVLTPLLTRRKLPWK